ncbi:hypothetical protein NFI96_021868 [Prochilodus magdalenae]|nr:hypothetical protein NFI96_021868 [Prochilodus magdalenae]
MKCRSVKNDKEYTVKTEASLGKIALVGLEKEQFLPFFDDDWFCCKVQVKTPDNEELHFPCYRWIKQRQLVCVREGTAVTISKDTNATLKLHRELELTERQTFYQRAELKIKFLANSKRAWESLEAIDRALFNKSDVYTYVQAHWEEDEFFGYQFLNGANPTVVHQCKRLPDNFPVTDAMVQASMEDSSLTAEIMARKSRKFQKGNVFLCDYVLLDGLPANTVNLRKQYVGAPLCLLYKNKSDKLIPIAIQCNQQAGEQNPIFLPEDSKEDWLLAKLYVRAADALVHQLNAHLLQTHLLAEVFALSTLRNLPAVHPVYKNIYTNKVSECSYIGGVGGIGGVAGVGGVGGVGVLVVLVVLVVLEVLVVLLVLEVLKVLVLLELLIPHMQYTLHINTLARERLIAKTGLINQYGALSQEGILTLLRKALVSLRYSTLCLPDNIEARGLKDIPDFYYRDDGQAVWDILTKYVGGVLKYYYSSDVDLTLDTELQQWIADIFVHGFLSNDDSKIPKAFHSVDDLVKFVTMVIFTATAQHSAVNNGQFDFGGWLPNSPISLQSPPRRVKGHATASTLLQTLPDVNGSVRSMAATWVLTRKPEEFVSLGNHSEEYFTEPDVVALATTMKDELKELSEKIKKRNEGKELPYFYLDPAEIENSVAI